MDKKAWLDEVKAEAARMTLKRIEDNKVEVEVKKAKAKPVVEKEAK